MVVPSFDEVIEFFNDELALVHGSGFLTLAPKIDHSLDPDNFVFEVQQDGAEWDVKVIGNSEVGVEFGFANLFFELGFRFPAPYRREPDDTYGAIPPFRPSARSLRSRLGQLPTAVRFRRHVGFAPANLSAAFTGEMAGGEGVAARQRDQLRRWTSLNGVAWSNGRFKFESAHNWPWLCQPEAVGQSDQAKAARDFLHAKLTIGADPALTLKGSNWLLDYDKAVALIDRSLLVTALATLTIEYSDVVRPLWPNELSFEPHDGSTITSEALVQLAVDVAKAIRAGVGDIVESDGNTHSTNRDARPNTRVSILAYRDHAYPPDVIGLEEIVNVSATRRWAFVQDERRSAAGRVEAWAGKNPGELTAYLYHDDASKRIMEDDTLKSSYEHHLNDMIDAGARSFFVEHNPYCLQGLVREQMMFHWVHRHALKDPSLDPGRFSYEDAHIDVVEIVCRFDSAAMELFDLWGHPGTTLTHYTLDRSFELVERLNTGVPQELRMAFKKAMVVSALMLNLVENMTFDKVGWLKNFVMRYPTNGDASVEAQAWTTDVAALLERIYALHYDWVFYTPALIRQITTRLQGHHPSLHPKDEPVDWANGNPSTNSVDWEAEFNSLKPAVRTDPGDGGYKKVSAALPRAGGPPIVGDSRSTLVLPVGDLVMIRVEPNNPSFADHVQAAAVHEQVPLRHPTTVLWVVPGDGDPTEHHFEQFVHAGENQVFQSKTVNADSPGWFFGFANRQTLRARIGDTPKGILFVNASESFGQADKVLSPTGAEDPDQYRPLLYTYVPRSRPGPVRIRIEPGLQPQSLSVQPESSGADFIFTPDNPIYDLGVGQLALKRQKATFSIVSGPATPWLSTNPNYALIPLSMLGDELAFTDADPPHQIEAVSVGSRIGFIDPTRNREQPDLSEQFLPPNSPT